MVGLREKTKHRLQNVRQHNNTHCTSVIADGQHLRSFSTATDKYVTMLDLNFPNYTQNTL